MGLFTGKKKQELIRREKSLIDDEVKAYRDKQIQYAETQILQAQKEVIENQKECARQLGQDEHEFHSTMEDRRIEIAKLEAYVDSLKDASNYYTKFYSEQVKIKDSEIKNLTEIIDSLIGKLDKIGSTVTVVPSK